MFKNCFKQSFYILKIIIISKKFNQIYVLVSFKQYNLRNRINIYKFYLKNINNLINKIKQKNKNIE